MAGERPKELHWMTTARIEMEEERIQNMEWLDTGLVDGEFGDWRIFVLPFIVAETAEGQVYKDEDIEKKFHTCLENICLAFLVYSFAFYFLQFDVGNGFLSGFVQVVIKRVFVYIVGYLAILLNLMLVYRSLFMDRRFAFGHFKVNICLVALDIVALSHGEFIFVKRRGLETLDYLCLFHIFVFMIFNTGFFALSWWIMFYPKDKKLKILRILRGLNEIENDIKRTKIVGEVVEDLLHQVEMAQDLETGFGVTFINPAGIAETAV